MSEEKSVPEMVMEQEKQGNVVFEGIEGTMGAKISEFIQQPVEGILYDLNRDKVTLFSQYSKDNIRWINDYAVAVTITALRAELERVKAENEKKTAALELIIIRCNMADFDILTVGAICKMRELAREALLPAAPEEGE